MRSWNELLLSHRSGKHNTVARLQSPLHVLVPRKDFHRGPKKVLFLTHPAPATDARLNPDMATGRRMSPYIKSARGERTARTVAREEILARQTSARQAR